jgi:hypothetical protein
MTSEQLLSLYGVGVDEQLDDSVPFVNLPSREQVLQRIGENKNFDLLIFGGGLTGAVLAHEAALKGIKVLLLERGYFGADALSWGVRIAAQMRSSPACLLRARTTFKDLAGQRAPHLIAAMPHDSHVVTGIVASAIKRFVPLVQVDERLLIRETILAAKQEGAAILSAITPIYLEAESAESGCYAVEFEDQLTKERYQARVGGVLIDPTHGDLPPSRLGTYVIPDTKHKSEPHAAGVQIIYQAVPRSAKGGLSFVSFELTDGSFIAVQRRGVQTIEVTILWGVKESPNDQLPSVIDEAVSESGWVIQSELSQRQVAGRWSKHYGISQFKGVFTCHHRGAWDAYRSAQTIVKALVRLLPDSRESTRLTAPPLPGLERNCEADAFRALARAQGISEQTIERVVSRWRGRVRYLGQFANGLREFIPGVLRAEVDLAVASDQVSSLDDLVFGSLEMHRYPDWRDSLPELKERLGAFGVGGGE